MILVGDVRERIKEIGSGSVQSIITSPPFFGLRRYLGGESEIGLESSPDCLAWARAESPCGDCFVCALREVWGECWRVLRDDGAMFWNIGDSYWRGKGASGSPNPEKMEKRRGGGDTYCRQKTRVVEKGQIAPTDRKHDTIRAKSLTLIPQRIALALQADGWIIRSQIIWSKTNPAPESTVTPLGAEWIRRNAPIKTDAATGEEKARQPREADRPHDQYEVIILATKCPRYYWDADGYALEVSQASQEREKRGRSAKHKYADTSLGAMEATAGKSVRTARMRAIPTKSELARVDRDRACRYRIEGGGRHDGSAKPPIRVCRNVWSMPTAQNRSEHFAAFNSELPRRCILLSTRAGDLVFDPFGGSGTTAAAAESLGRRWVSIDLDARSEMWHREAVGRVNRPLPL